MHKLQILVLYGGTSKEHDVSVRSGQAIIDNINNKTYDVAPALITKDGQWEIDDKRYSLSQALDLIQAEFDFVMIALHGTFGEDGTIQALFEERGIAFSGSRSHSSRLAMDKHETARYYHDAGLLTPKEYVLHKGFEQKDLASINDEDFPLIVKPVAQGSSFGISKVAKPEELLSAIEHAFIDTDRILIQQFISGREVSAGVIENDMAELVALSPTELILLQSEFFDYEAKYTKGATKEVTPPNMPAEVIEDIKHHAVIAHRILGCSSYSRTDMIVADNGIYVIETNTLPGMTETSILPQQLNADKITFSRALDWIIQAGLRS